MSNRWRRAATVVATLGTVLMATVVTAAGVAAAEPGEIGPAEAAPSCFSLTQWDDLSWTGYRSYAHAQSGCNLTYRVRMIWNNDFDGSCKTVLPGTGFTESRIGKIPSVDELRLC